MYGDETTSGTRVLDPGRVSARGAGLARRGWRTGVGILGEALLTLGTLVLLFVVWQVWWVTREATSASAAVVTELGREFATAPLGPPRTAPGEQPRASTLRSEAVALGEPFGLITVPRFGNGPQPVLQGTDAAQLAGGVGHDRDSAMPGQIGNFATAGHRDTYSHPYNRIDWLRGGDLAVVEVQGGWAIYEVAGTRIVEPSQIEVYSPTPDRPGVEPTEAWMTLVACEPHWTAQKRWVVHARLQEWVPRSRDRPAAPDNPQVAAALADPAGAST